MFVDRLVGYARTRPDCVCPPAKIGKLCDLITIGLCRSSLNITHFYMADQKIRRKLNRDTALRIDQTSDRIAVGHTVVGILKDYLIGTGGPPHSYSLSSPHR